ncbi:MAG: sel1 repeat family protein [Mogibacterium sp.]|nr:sel1 repeat family protein [Mogibacterium sp.]
MTVMEAQRIINKYYNISNPSEEDQFEFIEALEYLIHETHDPEYMMRLGGEYYGWKRFDLALKYYEMAAEYDHEYACECLGYIWYYGRTGTKNFEKAFKYFSKSADKGNLVCKYKVADMYKNGYYVDKDYEKYKQIIEELYPLVADAKYLDAPLPEVFTRLARIRAEELQYLEAVDLFTKARWFLEQRISYNAFFGNLNIMKWLIEDLYQLVVLDPNNIWLYDLYEILKTPAEVSFMYGDRKFTVRSQLEGDECVIEFDHNWYRTIDDFFAKACIDDKRLTSIYDELYAFTLL